MSTIPKSNVQNGNTIEAQDVKRIIDALDGTTPYEIIISGSTSQGFSNRVGLSSHAEGYNTSASGDFSHTEGSNTRALGSFSHAEGYGTLSNGNGSHAEGNTSNAEGTYSHSEGVLTNSKGYGSHAEGNTTISSGSYSHSEGINTIALGDGQSVVGRYNNQIDSSSLFIVGIGTSDVNRKNGFEVRTSGSIVISTGSALPTWIGKEGEMQPVKIGSNYYIATYIGGAWRSSSLF